MSNNFQSLKTPLATTPNTIQPTKLASYLDELLSVNEFQDYCPNGLQVDANTPISHIVTGVSASLALIEQAIEKHAEAILVHHGYFWKGEAAVLTGMKGKRIRGLLQHNISLLAYHLPLDAHPIFGNNAQLAHALDLTLDEALYPDEKHPIGNICNLKTPIKTTDFCQKIQQVLGKKPLHLVGGNSTLSRIGICTGAAQDMLEQAAKQGCDAYLSGEVSERTTHIARELGIDYFACGHHATERGGVQALGNYIQQNFGIKVSFVDIDNPV
ncbi:NIF3 family protein [Moraxella macacae 0408225]|uniref:NIF3 family protein n=1 Tax=Moraxella macacae 0408225 TaxID=1230338 RepID=L2F7G0_9GAMM|nr:Nif3-like dinuclear metal center hexameric protein [Moraxella macacae]ELA08840.1 NIF3 family protein [Moraxella macacae 0408225]